MNNLYNKLKKYSKKNVIPMHMPGHKRNIKMLSKKLPYDIDITEINDFDDLHHPEGIIKNIQDKAIKLYKSKKSYILVNGSTCGILAGIRAVIKPHDKILIARNCHKSVYNAIELNSLIPIYVSPKIDEFGINKGIDKEDIKKALEENKDIKLVVITSPTYEGVISNIKEISEVVHKYNIPLLVDEAHGAHLNFDKELKKYEALNSNADIVIQSFHKTLPSLTQTAIIHINGNIVDTNKIEKNLAIFETSSPSYILMSSIEECMDILENKSEELFYKYRLNLDKFYKDIRVLKNLKILGNEIEKDDIYDKGKIVIITKDTNINGQKLASILREKYKIEVEMAYTNYVIAMTSICDKKKNFRKLAKALLEIDKNIKQIAKIERNLEETDQSIPEKNLEIYETIEKKNIKKIGYKEAEGKISNEYIFVYPPGIPFIVPGEIIGKKEIAKLENFLSNDIKIRTTSNSFPKIEIIN